MCAERLVCIYPYAKGHNQLLIDLYVLTSQNGLTVAPFLNCKINGDHVNKQLTFSSASS